MTGIERWEGLKLTLHRERDEVSACLRTFLELDSGRRESQWCGWPRTLDQSSMSSSPAVVLMMTLPLVGRAIGRVADARGGEREGGALDCRWAGRLAEYFSDKLNVSFEEKAQ